MEREDQVSFQISLEIGIRIIKVFKLLIIIYLMRGGKILDNFFDIFNENKISDSILATIRERGVYYSLFCIYTNPTRNHIIKQNRLTGKCVFYDKDGIIFGRYNK